MQLIPGFSANGRHQCCSACGQGPGKVNPRDNKSVDRLVLDTGIDIDFEGHVQLCLTCASEAGSLTGQISEAQAQDLVDQAAEEKARADKAEADLDAARKAVTALTNEYERRPVKKAPVKKASAKVAAK